MYSLTDQQIDFILNDIKIRGVEMENLQLNLLDHICCIIENECEQGDDFKSFYQKTISSFFKKELKEIEQETILLLTFKNYYEMKKTMIVSGTAAVILLMAGSFFKLMHWPGAGPLVVLGIVFISLVFLPLLFLTKTREAASTQDKLVMGLGALVGILYCLSTLFQVMHWPGVFILLTSTIVLSAFVFIPVYFFTGIKNPDTKANTIVTSVLLIGATSILFMMMNIRPPKKEIQLKMYNYLQGEEMLTKMRAKQTIAVIANTESSQLLAEINSNCEEIKSLILKSAIGEKSISKDFEARDILLEDGGLGGEFYENREGAKLISQLKDLLNKYNASASNKIPIEHSALDANFGNIANYNVYSVLNSITQLQLFMVCVNS